MLIFRTCKWAVGVFPRPWEKIGCGFGMSMGKADVRILRSPVSVGNWVRILPIFVQFPYQSPHFVVRNVGRHNIPAFVHFPSYSSLISMRLLREQPTLWCVRPQTSPQRGAGACV